MLFDIKRVLDKGEVALLSSSNDSNELRNICSVFLNGKSNLELMKIANATMMIKCPLFVQLDLSRFDFKIIDIKTDNIEAYIPNVGEIGAKSVEEKRRMYRYFDQTINALILNAKGLPMDGCDSFIAQTTMPVSIYNRLIVHGDLTTWLKYTRRKGLPSPVEAYRTMIHNIVSAHWIV